MVAISDKSPREQTKDFYDNLVKQHIVTTNGDYRNNAVTVMCAEDSMLEEEAHKFSFIPENSSRFLDL